MKFSNFVFEISGVIFYVTQLVWNRNNLILRHLRKMCQILVKPILSSGEKPWIKNQLLRTLIISTRGITNVAQLSIPAKKVDIC